MGRMQSLFSTAIDPEEVLEDFIQCYHDHGNYIGGYKVDDMPERIKNIAEALERAEYLKYRSFSDRYCVKEEYREKLLIPYNWEELFRNYVSEKLENGWTYSKIISGYGWVALDYHAINEEDKEKKYEAEWKLRNELMDRVSVEEIIEYCFQGGCETRLGGIYKLDEIIDKLVKASTEDEVDGILNKPIKRKFNGEDEKIKFTYGREYKIAFANLTNREKVKEILGEHMPGVEWVH